MNVGLNVRLSDTQKGMIDLLKDNPKLNAQEIAVLLNKSKKTIERNFIELKKIILLKELAQNEMVIGL